MRRTTILLALLCASCGDGATPDAGPPDGGPAPVCESVPTLAPGDPTGHPEPLGAGAGEARAGRLPADALPPDPDGMLAWRPGDFVLANDRVAFVVEDVGLSDEFDPHGGQPVGIASMEAGALVDAADFNELFFTLGRATVATRSVSVIDDGSGGGPAIVRAIGPVSTLGFLDFFEPLIRGELDGLEAAIDYALAPDANEVEVRITLASGVPTDLLVRQPLLFAFQQNRMPKFGPGEGFTLGAGVAVPYAAFVADGATSYAFESARGDLSVFLEQANLLAIGLPRFSIDRCTTTEHALGRFYVGRPGLDGVLASVARGRGEARDAVSGTVRTSDGAPAAGVHVHAHAPDGEYLTRATTGADGTFVLHAPGSSVVLRAFRQGEAPGPDVTASVPSSGAELAFGATGELVVHVTDAASGEPIPALVQAAPLGAAPPSPPAEWGERRVLRTRADVRYSTDGEARLRVPAGDYSVIVSRGYEYEAMVLSATVTDGGSLELAAALDHVIDTPGVMCGDFHIHTNRSFDAEDDVRGKVRAAVAEGVEIPVRSDHEWVGDFEPVIAELGVTEHAYGIASIELTTFLYGHAGVFPLDPDPSARNRGAIDWVRRDPPAVFDDAHARTGRFGRAEVIINHPRLSGALLGYFNAAGYDPTTGLGREGFFWEDFTLLEVFNESDFDENEATTVRDWLSLLDHGRRVFAVGSSDSHEVWRQTMGYPRTCVDVGVDTAPELRALGAGHVRDRMLEGASIVVGGVYVEPSAPSSGGPIGPGGTLTGAAAREAIDVRVRAPSWVAVDRLRVYVDGALVDTLAIDATTEDPLEPTIRFDAPVEVPVGAATSYAIFVADGDGDLAPVHPGHRPFGVSNPIFLSR